MIYAFRHNGKGGVVKVPWDTAFFFPDRRASSPAFGGAPTVLRCFVLAEDGKTVVDSFSFGKLTVNGGSETSPWGEAVLMLLHYIAQLTSREPIWPDDVQQASQPEVSSVNATI